MRFTTLIIAMAMSLLPAVEASPIPFRETSDATGSILECGKAAKLDGRSVNVPTPHGEWCIKDDA